jgi:hypothetical protein
LAQEAANALIASCIVGNASLSATINLSWMSDVSRWRAMLSRVSSTEARRKVQMHTSTERLLSPGRVIGQSGVFCFANGSGDGLCGARELRVTIVLPRVLASSVELCNALQVRIGKIKKMRSKEIAGAG